MMTKAEGSFLQAKLLFDKRMTAGAASRAYYAIHQGLVSKFQSLGRRREEFVDPGSSWNDDRRKGWPHGGVVSRATEAGLDREQFRLAWDALEARVKADYYPDPIEPYEVEDVIANLPDILTSLGSRKFTT